MMDGVELIGSLTMNIALILICTFFIASIIAILSSIKKNNIRNKPSSAVVIVIALQVLVFILFFANILANLQEEVVSIIWWGIVLAGFIVSIKDFKNNSMASTLCILLSICLAALKLLLFAITSM
ncbi:Invasion gene expression up-regulator SirB [Sporosarcina sp. ANT_H38]